MAFARLLVVVVICCILFAQAQRARGRRFRRLSMLVGAAAFGVLALSNAIQLAGVDLSSYALVVIGLPVLLLLASVVLLVRSWRVGEMRSQLDQGRRTLAEEMKRRR